jgi:hypothetical protein
VEVSNTVKLKITSAFYGISSTPGIAYHFAGCAYSQTEKQHGPHRCGRSARPSGPPDLLKNASPAHEGNQRPTDEVEQAAGEGPVLRAWGGERPPAVVLGLYPNGELLEVQMRDLRPWFQVELVAFPPQV